MYNNLKKLTNMFDKFNNNDGERKPRPRFRREEGAPMHAPRPRFHREGESRPFNQEGEGRPRFHREGEGRPHFSHDGSERRPQGFGFKKPNRNNGVYSNKKQQVYREQHEDPTKPVRLNKFLANAGICSRREADDFIQAGVITVNGEGIYPAQQTEEHGNDDR